MTSVRTLRRRRKRGQYFRRPEEVQRELDRERLAAERRKRKRP